MAQYRLRFYRAFWFILRGKIVKPLLLDFIFFDTDDRSQYHSRPRRVSQYLHLAISIIIDLQLDRAPEYRFWKHIVSFDGENKKDSVSWGREEQRAVIGCFYFSSTQVVKSLDDEVNVSNMS